MTNRTTVGAVALVIGIGANGAETHSAHEHGHAVLKLVQEDTEVVVHFESPLDSIVGFEHEPENDEQRAALEEAMQIVRVSENIVRLPATCTSSGEPEVHVPYIAHDHGDDHGDDHGEDHADDHGEDHADDHGEDHGDDHGEDHGDDHADHDGDGHGDHHDAADEHSEAAHDDHEATGEHGDDHHADGDHHHANEEGDVHADLEATFKFRCESSLEWLEATAFATFDGLEEIELQAVGPDAAVVETLTPASPRAVLSGP